MDAYPGYRVEVTDVFVRPGVALEFNQGSGVALRGVEFTEDSPMLEVDRIEVGADGMIGRWSLWYDLEMWELWGSPGFRMDAAREVLDAHAAAWTSTAPGGFETLYAPDADRIDDLVGWLAAGSTEIATVAARLAERSVTIERGALFSDSRKAAADVDVVGARHDVTTVDGCIVRFVVVVTAQAGLINREEVFWDPASLVACGWAG